MKQFVMPSEGGLNEAILPKSIVHSFEKIYTEIYKDALSACEDIADLIVGEINDFLATEPDRSFRLGLTTGRTPISLYKALTKRYKSGLVSFARVDVFSIDEYYPIARDARQSRNSRLHEEFLNLVDVDKERIHIPDGEISHEDISDYCAEFDKQARGLDLLVIGVGEGGQVGFNDAGSTPQSHTRTVPLSYRARKRQSKNFNNAIEDTPNAAITMGISTMKSAKKIVLMAWGEGKAEAVKNIVEGEVTSACPATYFQDHENIRFYVDQTAGKNLSRIVAPWLVGPCNWSPKLIRAALVWLCQTVDKPILKLTLQDYLENSLGELVDKYGPFDKLNIDVFNDLQHTITGWPGGKSGADDSTRPVPSQPYPKTVLIFSPHPDDDVISMGGTFIRLVNQGHDVHVAYETSGDLAVHDDVVLQHMDSAYQLGFGDRIEPVRKLIAAKTPGEPEPRELLALKAAIRRAEARAAVRSFGLNSDTNVHFLNLPFYESGGVAKFPATQVDIDIVKDIIARIRPNQIYMAGDLADPHGTHRICTEVALEAISQLKIEGNEWLNETQVWLYRGAWMEWELSKVDMAVPLSPDEVVEKRHAIFRHQSQKDIVPFPGEDPREFWQRAEERTSNTARLYDKLGMAEYQAIEVFVRCPKNF